MKDTLNPICKLWVVPSRPEYVITDSICESNMFNSKNNFATNAWYNFLPHVSCCKKAKYAKKSQLTSINGQDSAERLQKKHALYIINSNIDLVHVNINTHK